MKKIIPAFFTIIIIGALLVGMAYAVDHTRMEAGEPVVFSTWGKDYTPAAEAEDNPATEPTAEPVADPKPEIEEPTKTEVTLYFPDMNIINLCSETRTLEPTDNIPKAVVEAVIAGPESDDLLPAVTNDVKVLSAKVADDSSTCVVDLSKEFVLGNTGGSDIETFAIYSIVNSLCQLPGITDVKINIDGNENAVFGGHYDISVPIEADMTLVK